MIVYISGKITGDPNYREKFRRVEDELRERGHTVLNPAWLPDGLDDRQYMSIDYDMLLASDAVLQLPDWRNSNGALWEAEEADRLEIPRSERIEELEAMKR